MSQVVPDAIEVEVLNSIFSGKDYTLRIYGNNVTPSGLSQAADFTEIVGGGYAAKDLLSSKWLATSGDPSFRIYDTTQIWTFTGAVDAPGTIFGYFVTRNSDGNLLMAERFPEGILPFSPVNGSIIKVLPKFTCQSAF